MINYLEFSVFLKTKTKTFRKLKEKQFYRFLFALSNGYATSAVMVLGPEQMHTKDEKETTGFIMNNGLYLGMMCGAFLALTFKNIGK